MYLIMYDIVSDSKRTHFANTLVAFGYERLQKSVFVGTENPKKFPSLHLQLKNIVSEDSIIVINISKTSFKKLKKYGTFSLDMEYLCNEKRSMII
ncbi:CRISPR-associated Cas2 family protein [Kordia periserrulae]|uniref:CRISPR-associated endoribonuclease Cas2 n=1 Tax=Kordia periserrulae TaxID=701523 RepID=A0A2T6BUW2_9FLAO|nr:CRISPR-associated Cas2 family protein [Kordia periserrulae]